MTEPGRTPSARFTAWRYEAEHRLAPHVEETWAEAFLLELRLRDVPGRAIGDALTEVESHCVESGEPAAEAFGDPTAYARSLDLPTTTDPLAFSLGTALRWVLQSTGLLITTVAAPAWLADEALEPTTGLLAIALVVGASLVAVHRAADRVLRFVVGHPVVAWLVMMLHLAVMAALMLVLDDVLARVAPGPSLVVGLVLLVAGTLAVLQQLRRDTSADDDPVTATVESSPGPTRAARVLMRFRYAPAFLAPLAAVLFVGLDVLMA